MSGGRPALVLQMGGDAPPGLLATWLARRGIAMHVHPLFAAAEGPDAAGHRLVVALGSTLGGGDVHEPAVAAEHEVLRGAVAAGVPVLGLCHGGQALASVLGAEVGPTPVPERGWHAIETDEPQAVPAGPWLQWHHDRFAVPDGAEELARSSAGPQAFRSGPHLGVQFHPEATPEIVRRWAREDPEHRAGLAPGEDPEATVDSGLRHAGPARDAAERLFDAFLARAEAAAGGDARACAGA